MKSFKTSMQKFPDPSKDFTDNAANELLDQFQFSFNNTEKVLNRDLEEFNRVVNKALPTIFQSIESKFQSCVAEIHDFLGKSDISEKVKTLKSQYIQAKEPLLEKLTLLPPNTPSVQECLQSVNEENILQKHFDSILINNDLLGEVKISVDNSLQNHTKWENEVKRVQEQIKEIKKHCSEGEAALEKENRQEFLGMKVVLYRNHFMERMRVTVEAIKAEVCVILEITKRDFMQKLVDTI